MSKPNFSELIASRICHDLISPVGAISNGMELLAMSGQSSPELALISDSAEAASARVRLFRLAFGRAGDGQSVSAHEMRALCAELSDARLQHEWQVAEAVPRAEAKAACLAALCCERALARGGLIRSQRGEDGRWHIAAEGPQLRSDPALWTALEQGETPCEVAADTVNFALLPEWLARQGRQLVTRIEDSRITLSF
ncbi:histidine phosphotransferase family protein [Cognatishimia sp. SS12]|uniref:histidine phosphotransferase family protein n=1 Tax=Cognatishimia sp. SS12 TaxID=2979465 RepID=UPI0023313F15|nr:histidine phosphotransferase family protein [Cognatishimia sp. SS12]MDC0737189.1 histidine phosphotransferase family protein [Cognatishimia sp. SS12]